jgi:superfamily II DNA or RNA helicase
MREMGCVDRPDGEIVFDIDQVWKLDRRSFSIVAAMPTIKPMMVAFAARKLHLIETTAPGAASRTCSSTTSPERRREGVVRAPRGRQRGTPADETVPVRGRGRRQEYLRSTIDAGGGAPKFLSTPEWNPPSRPSVCAAVPDEKELRELVPPQSIARGDLYYAQGRVLNLELLEDGIIAAHVRGTHIYEVVLDFTTSDLNVACNCPWFEQEGEGCKHIWATIRAASAAGLLSDGDLFADEMAWPPPFIVGRDREKPPAWKRFLEALRPDPPRAPHTAQPVPEEIAYVIAQASPHLRSLILNIVGRARRKAGDWGKWRPLAIRETDLALLPQFDRETIALLCARQWSMRIEPLVNVPDSTTPWWIERLGRAGRLFVRDTEGDLVPVGWDDGPPWTFRVAIVNEAGEARYRIAGSMEREGETLSLDAIEAIFPGVLVSGGRASRFDDSGSASWLDALHANGPVEIPHTDVERFRQALLKAPVTNISLPEDLGWSIVDIRPRPVLSLQHQPWTAELSGQLAFQYEEWLVPSRSRETQTTIGRKLIRRNPAIEDGFRARLGVIAISTTDGYRFRGAQFEETARKLLAEGWTLNIDSAPVRVADRIDVDLSSGIDWFDLNVTANFGELSVALPELLAANEAKRSMLRLEDGSFGIVPASWSESLAPVLELGKSEGSALRFRLPQALLIDALLQSTPHKTDVAFADRCRSIAGAAPVPRKEPPTLAAELRSYQRAGLGWLHFLREAGLGGCLADDMGLGKTVQTLALLEELRADGNRRPSLVVAPKSLLFNWVAEAQRFAPKLRVLEHHGSEREDNVLDDYDLVLTTYATMRLDIARLVKTEFEYVILDEAQAIKNASSQVAKASRLLRGSHRLALSGTPIENHLGELWSLFEFLNPGLLGSARSFNRTFAAKTAPADARAALARALRPLILRRTKEQVAPELPERTQQTLYCELEGKQRKQYDELRAHYRTALLGRIRSSGIDKSRMHILEALLRLRQAACHPALAGAGMDSPSAKVDLLMDELREVVGAGHRALIFSQFTSFLAIVRDAIETKRFSYLYLDGKTRNRGALVDAFQRPDGPSLFLISLKAGGLGLNLTNADYVFLLDPWWNPAVEAQAIDRAHRIGRLKPVVAYRLIARDTVEEKILELQGKKREIAESIISEDNSVLRKLEIEDLELLLS